MGLMHLTGIGFRITVGGRGSTESLVRLSDELKRLFEANQLVFRIIPNSDFFRYDVQITDKA